MTFRAQVANLGDIIFMTCRKMHDSSYVFIDLVKNAIDGVDYDPELIAFLDDCLEEMTDPRGNPFFHDTMWPDLSVTTQYDTSPKYQTIVNELTLAFQIMDKYR